MTLDEQEQVNFAAEVMAYDEARSLGVTHPTVWAKENAADFLVAAYEFMKPRFERNVHPKSG